MPIRICHGCAERLTTASNALRRHASQMQAAIQLTRTRPTEQQLEDARTNLRESFNQAQAAWDEYSAHLMEHGILSTMPASTMTLR